MSKLSHSYFHLLLLFLALHNTFGYSKKIEVPAVRDPDVLSLKLGTLNLVDEPGFKFNKVYERYVSRLEQIDFHPCK